MIDVTKRQPFCNNCIHAKEISSTRRGGTSYKCSKIDYKFKSYWLKTRASECKLFKDKRDE